MSSIKRRSGDLLQIANRFRAPSSDTTEVVFNYFSALDTPKSLAAWLLYKNGEHDQLVALDVDVNAYGNNPFRFRLDYAAISFLSKAVFLKTTFDKREVGIAKFLKYEDQCKRTNRRFLNPIGDPLNQGSNVWLLNATKRKIAEILGSFSSEEFVENANWGPGVSTLIKGEDVSAVNKFRSESGITRDLLYFVREWFPLAYPSWCSYRSPEGSNPQEVSWFTEQLGNEVVTVPKTSKTDRVIAIEPGINLWFQKSIGTMIRRRLGRVGIDLNSQAKNQRLAKLGSIDSSLATVDFSSASDSISTEVIRELLPPDWFRLMDVCRSKLGQLDGSAFRWEKFSSMGNAFTFELESLVFFASAAAVLELKGHPLNMERTSVYGDDVIIPSDCFELYSSYCAFLGFTVNSDKSFSSGYFRESCGSHFFDGVTCKPIFLKEKLCHVESFYKLANSIRNHAHRCNFDRSCDARFLDCWSDLLRRVPEPLRLRVPVSAGDVGFIGNFDESTPSRARYGIEGYYYRALSTVPVMVQTENPHLILARVREVRGVSPPLRRKDKKLTANAGRDISYENSYSLRGRTRRVITNPLVQLWSNLGGWE